MTSEIVGSYIEFFCHWQKIHKEIRNLTLFQKIDKKFLEKYANFNSIIVKSVISRYLTMMIDELTILDYNVLAK